MPLTADEYKELEQALTIRRRGALLPCDDGETFADVCGRKVSPDISIKNLQRIGEVELSNAAPSLTMGDIEDQIAAQETGDSENANE